MLTTPPSYSLVENALVEAMSREFLLEQASHCTLGMRILENAERHLYTGTRDSDDKQARRLLLMMIAELSNHCRVSLKLWSECA